MFTRTHAISRNAREHFKNRGTMREMSPIFSAVVISRVSMPGSGERESRNQKLRGR